MAIRNVLILGGYGNFGKRIAISLSVMEDITVFIAGRDINKAEKLSQELDSKTEAAADFKAVAIDINSFSFLDSLKALSPDILIHTSGSFQGQDYTVPESCITVGSHYIDLADDRRFVCDITSLNDQALAQGVLAVSGASSVPGLSSTVIDSFINEFSRLDEIDCAIAPGNKSEQGEATVRAILSYTGHSFKVFENGDWVNKRYRLERWKVRRTMLARTNKQLSTHFYHALNRLHAGVGMCRSSFCFIENLTLKISISTFKKYRTCLTRALH